MSQRIYPITMPKWGIEMQEGTITAWNASVGQSIAKGDALLDVETEKIVNSVEAPVSGTLRRIIADVGGTEAVGALIAVVAGTEVPDAEIDAFIAAFKPADTSFEPDSGSEAAAAAAPAPAQSAPVAPANLSVPGGEGEQRVSPIARRLAEKLGIDGSKI
jgi:pyruvate dehydrogenase E2 component (dihydrolipoamide acetyltransferase)